MDPTFESKKREMIAKAKADPQVKRSSQAWIDLTAKYLYSYNFTWMGRPIIQFPQDMVAMQEIIWSVRPDLIIETGVAHGGSLVYYASLLQLLGGDGRVIGIDIDIRAHNRAAIESHPMAGRIDLIQGSSVDPAVVDQVRARTRGRRAIVCLDSNHTHEHVLRELEAYSPFVGRGSYLVVFDTVVEDMPADAFPNRPWSRGNNPKTAVREFLRRNDRFTVDADVEDRVLLTVCPEGYLRCVKD